MAEQEPSGTTPQDAEQLPERIRVHALAKRLGVTSKRILAKLTELGADARSAQSNVDRAIAESNTHAPDIGLTLPTLLATIKVPAKVLARRIANAEARRTVERIYDELVATGTVERNLPEDDRTGPSSTAICEKNWLLEASKAGPMPNVIQP